MLRTLSVFEDLSPRSLPPSAMWEQTLPVRPKAIPQSARSAYALPPYDGLPFTLWRRDSPTAVTDLPREILELIIAEVAKGKKIKLSSHDPDN